MHRRRLPIGIQTFAKIREADHYYVDKTGFIRRLIDEGSQYFLSRPRRFGKSLLIDTIAELFAGNEPLFRGLLIHPDWDWTTRYPVIRISFGGGVLQSRAHLDERIAELLRINRETLGVTVHPDLDVASAFGELIRQAHAAVRPARGRPGRRIRQTHPRQRCMTRTPPAPCATACAICTRSSRTTTPTSVSPFSPA